MFLISWNMYQSGNTSWRGAPTIHGRERLAVSGPCLFRGYPISYSDWQRTVFLFWRPDFSLPALLGGCGLQRYPWTFMTRRRQKVGGGDWYVSLSLKKFGYTAQMHPVGQLDR